MSIRVNWIKAIFFICASCLLAGGSERDLPLSATISLAGD